MIAASGMRAFRIPHTVGATAESVFPQAVRYALISGASLALNALGEYAIAEELRVPYVAARLCISVIVSLLWNLAMQRYVVFAAAPASGSIVHAASEKAH